ncbi:MAG: M23 family metallopeptidase [Candidatus Moraniibacteriota bacterium]
MSIQRKPFFILGLVVLLGSGLFFWRSQRSALAPSVSPEPNTFSDEAVLVPREAPPVTPSEVTPLERANERVTKKPFGIFIDPETSPVQPERFRGYHTGADFETFPEEAAMALPIRAVCDGKVLDKRVATGYGGMLVTSCTLSLKSVTVVYGHLALVSIPWRIGDTVTTGDILGNLGLGGSRETDGERKHLHLSIHKGEALNIRGYTSKKSELDSWIDPCEYFCGK